MLPADLLLSLHDPDRALPTARFTSRRHEQRVREGRQPSLLIKGSLLGGDPMPTCLLWIVRLVAPGPGSGRPERLQFDGAYLHLKLLRYLQPKCH